MDAMATVGTRMTVEDFLALPLQDDARRLELIEGEVVVTWPTPEHELIIVELVAALHSWTRAGPGRGRVLGAIDTAAGSSSILGPDVQYFADAERLLRERRTRPQPLGDIVVEVRSPSTWARDVGVKRRLYEEAGVPELWLVDPFSQSVVVYRRSERSTTFDIGLDLGADDDLTSPLLPGFVIPVQTLFA
jgi:Uma2 family endonuclease